MALLRLASPRPMCLNCLRHTLMGDSPRLVAPAYNQIRGKRKMKKRATINVKLLKDVKGFGPKGSIVPVVRGLFRNNWLPRGNAEYLPSTYGAGGSRAEAVRDPLFGREEDVVEVTSVPEPEAPTSRLRKAAPMSMNPERASELLEDILPPILPFERALIGPSNAPNYSIGQTSMAGSSPTLQPSNQIYGSVSTSDMADAVKDMLATTEGKDIPIAAADIMILPTMDAAGIEGDKLKRIGEFMIEIQITGGDPVMRNVSIRPARQSRNQGSETKSRGAGRILEEGRALDPQEPIQP